MTKKTTATANEYSTILRLMNLKPVSVPPLYKMIVGSYEGAILLSQILYWHSVMGRMYYKTDQDFMTELFMTEREFRRAKASIKTVPFILIKRKGVPAKTNYDVNYDLMASTLKNVLTSSDGVCTNWIGHTAYEQDETGAVQTITESTQENTKENTYAPLQVPEDENSRNKSKKPRSRRANAAPTIEEVIEFAKKVADGRNEQGYIKKAKEAFKFYNGNMQTIGASEWKDGKGNTINNWKICVKNYWLDKLSADEESDDELTDKEFSLKYGGSRKELGL